MSARGLRLPKIEPFAPLGSFLRETHDMRRCPNPACPERHLNLRQRDTSNAARNIRQGKEQQLRLGDLPDFMRRADFVRERGAPRVARPAPYVLPAARARGDGDE